VAVVLDAASCTRYYDRRDVWHTRALEFFKKEIGTLIIPTPIIPEVDHLIGTRLGPSARMTFYRSLADGEYFIADLPRDKYGRVEELNRQFANLALGFVDAAIVAISEFLDLPRIATTDRRHFAPLAAALELELLP
jgi:predicted nucleic acid-binding protein